MQPIPLPELTNAYSPLWIILVVVGAGIWGVSFLLFSRTSKNPSIALLAVSMLGVASAVVGMFFYAIGHPGWFDHREAQAKEARVQIEESYGLELSALKIIQLNWPESAPDRDFQVFGSMVNQKQVEGAQFEERTIYLVWADGQLQLSESEDGKSFSELETAE